MKNRINQAEDSKCDFLDVHEHNYGGRQLVMVKRGRNLPTKQQGDSSELRRYFVYISRRLRFEGVTNSLLLPAPPNETLTGKNTNHAVR